MFKFSKKMMYAIEVVLDIASEKNQKPLQSRDLAKKNDIPERYLEQVMQRLVRAGILAGVRGPRGGYLLARKADEITVAEIIEIVLKLDQSKADLMEKAPNTTGAIALSPLMDEFNTFIMGRLNEMTIDGLLANHSIKEEAETSKAA